ncbi:MAG: hypothetical protein V5B31_02175 [Candidatus Accumulibacter propinquus]|jgi:hypothetical protein|uniref:hypothetical protein n=1 Tax=Candidatus Accumulibacter propinquus TaxID=2954380 RepID=UPI002FC2D296
MSDEHRQMAYWSVVKDLEPAADIPLARLRAAMPEFFRFSGEPKRAGSVLFDCLAGIPWDWPAWETFAKKAGYDSLRTISLAIARMRPAEVLKARSLTQLRDLCTERSITHLSRATKQALIDALMKGASADVAAAIVFPFRQALHEEANEKCRAEMARHLAYRILSVAYNRERLDQLRDPELLSMMPFWKFHWCGHTDIDAPKSCRRFDGKRLEPQAAITTFPELPCSYLRCVCRLSADTARS